MGAQNQRSEAEDGARLDLRVPATPRMVSEVRRAFGGLALPAPALDDARLLVSELVTNSIRHAGLHPDDLIHVRAYRSSSKLRVDVIDRAEVVKPRVVAGSISPLPGAESGWGLYLVDRVATRWGRGRGRYWFELELERQTKPRRG